MLRVVRVRKRLRLRRPVMSRSSRPADSSRPELVNGTATAHRDLSREVRVGQLASEEHVVSRLLHARLGPDELAEADRLMGESSEFRGFAACGVSPAERRMLMLHCAMWHGVDSVAEKTGLRRHEPPEDIHAMARGPLAAAVALYEADLVADALASVGVRIEEIGTALDFGCSSGRVVRVLAAAFPSVRWRGCDPNAEAIAWARENIPGIDFSVSGNEPPLSLEDEELDVVFAISIWSHFEPQLGMRWLDEMRRIVKPGGHLVMTTHGLTSVSYYAANRLRKREQCEQIADALYKRGWWYAAEFGAQGDWGVVNPAWGTSFLSPEWMLVESCPAWHILEFAAGRNGSNQDVYVLERA